MDNNYEQSNNSTIKTFLTKIGTILAVAIFPIGGLILLLMFINGTPWISKTIYPFIANTSSVALFIGVPICLLLAIFKRSRGIGGAGLVISSYLIGINLWVWSLIVAYSLAGVVWMITGILAGGIGIVPIAIIASVLKSEWSLSGQMLLMAGIVFSLRFGGIYLASKN